ncbi:two component transcriptional regulator, LuxR family [Tangfeifania diversioriginum]|uniref:Two component transcriptional regulator, LuxR family n=1 Tax=Tangfeifania diversioriginum TaxID=1168035 RepID=A0A1M6M424_9BACT|nr:response regulator transcription factor [Tangfeifania diversioriginum]SHJ78209.1 two component transcriptional regulator, LuxR family [Tangfeifania diversioriginum]
MVTNQKIDLVITDDHKLFRKGLSSLLSDFEFIGNIYEASTGIELLELLQSVDSKPDIILLDLQMPEMDGIAANKELKKVFPDIKVIILTMEDDAQLILHLIRQGVNGYLMKDADPDELETAIKSVIEKDFYFSDNISQLIYRNLNKKRKKNSGLFIHKFTPREIQTLELICREYTAAEIADELNLSVRTIEGYRSNLLDKSGAKNIAGLVVFALTNDLVNFE